MQSKVDFCKMQNAKLNLKHDREDFEVFFFCNNERFNHLLDEEAMQMHRYNCTKLEFWKQVQFYISQYLQK